MDHNLLLQLRLSWCRIAAPFRWRFNLPQSIFIVHDGEILGLFRGMKLKPLCTDTINFEGSSRLLRCEKNEHLAAWEERMPSWRRGDTSETGKVDWR